MKRWLCIFAALVAPFAGQTTQSKPEPQTKTDPQAKPKEGEAGGVFRLPSQMPADPEPPKAKEEPKPVVMTNNGAPIRIPFSCTDDDIQMFGMTCTLDDPCPVYADFSAVQSLGQKLFVTGNFHNGASTMYSILLVSTDAGRTWTEPLERYKSGGLDQIQFFDFETGWIAGQTLLALPRDPFFLLTTDGGATWRKRFVFAETRLGTIENFHFESRTAGALVIDRGQGAEGGGRWERYESMTGGDSWMVRDVSSRPLTLKNARELASTGWRLQADSKQNSHLVQRKSGERWATVASFLVKVGECKPSDSAIPEPPPATESAAPATAPGPSVAPRRGPAGRPSLKKK